MLSTTQLGKAHGARALFSGVSLKLNTGARYGLVGANGAGKTTFLQILTGDQQASEGAVSFSRGARVGVLRQDRFLSDDEVVVEVAARGDAAAWEALCAQRRLESGEGALELAADYDERVRALDGYTLEARAGAILVGLGIAAGFHRGPMAALSGGMKLRVLLAQALLGGADVLLLDEPTNHLDIVSIRWLEQFLAGYRGCAVIISHDQRFLDTVASHTLDVDYETITLYTGNYSAFVREKAAIRAQREAENARKEAEIAHKQAYVDRFRFKASKASQAQSLIKQIEKIEVDALATSSRRAPSFQFAQRRPSGRDVLSLDGLCKSYGDREVLRDVRLTLRRGERLAIIGANGLGKSTLLKVLAGRIEPSAGRFVWGHEVSLGYFAQDHREVLTDAGKTALKVIEETRPNESLSYHRGMLGRALFSGEAAYKPVSSLSGGEAARLVFAKIMVEEPNVLLLDEPTNHLDIEAIDALTEALKRYEGTVIFVSHDRRFVAELGTRVLELTPEGINDFAGTYDEYLSRSGDDHLDADAAVLRQKREKAAQQSAAPAPALSWDEQKRRRNLAKQLPLKRDKALAAVEAAEARLAEIHRAMAQEGFYERSPKTERDALLKEEQALGPKIEALMAEWESLEAECAALTP